VACESLFLLMPLATGISEGEAGRENISPYNQKAAGPEWRRDRVVIDFKSVTVSMTLSLTVTLISEMSSNYGSNCEICV
jgi:hypothetical protein